MLVLAKNSLLKKETVSLWVVVMQQPEHLCPFFFLKIYPHHATYLKQHDHYQVFKNSFLMDTGVLPFS
jgi:hypothetical protein